MAFKVPLLKNDEQRPLLEAVHKGEMTPSEADIKSTELGFGPLAREPAMASYRVQELPTWNLVMAIAWILWRDHEAVTYFYDPYRERCLYWLENGQARPLRPIPRRGRHQATPSKPKAELKRLEPATFSNLGVVHYSDVAEKNGRSCYCKDHHQAQNFLWNALLMEEIFATGINNRTKAMARIDPSYWGLLSIVPTSGSDVASLSDINVPGYSKVKLRRQDVEHIWEPASQPKSVKPKANVSDDNPSDGLTPSFREVQWAVRQLWPDNQIPSRPIVRDRAIMDRLGAPDRRSTVSRKTIGRYFEEYPVQNTDK
ncbi:hypothetical protein MRS76_13385 [Rhizobiaceae bacterium n13]|uniref:hypothetical protein n=1 Tax=Ferirhizobium litorale TaxID=2927786 RepID=UPI0024B2D438|nr:hypothetical protein [Fererhizobium litorale]MDI7862951.1 hypothetical protein [Fererhizobium litorale]